MFTKVRVKRKILQPRAYYHDVIKNNYFLLINNCDLGGWLNLLKEIAKK